MRSFALNNASLRKVLAKPRSTARGPGPQHPVIVSLPAPNGGFQRFALTHSPVMAPGLAAKHPEIRTYTGSGIDDPTATSAPT